MDNGDNDILSPDRGDYFDNNVIDCQVGRGPDNNHPNMLLRRVQRATANTARNIASSPPLPSTLEVLFPSTPIFLGHGRDDEKVSVRLGGQARHALEAL